MSLFPSSLPCPFQIATISLSVNHILFKGCSDLCRGHWASPSWGGGGYVGGCVVCKNGTPEPNRGPRGLSAGFTETPLKTFVTHPLPTFRGLMNIIFF